MNDSQIGVYALLHRPSGAVYVGSTTHLHIRLNQWLNNIQNGRPLPRALQPISGDASQWATWVLFRGDVDGDTLASLEQRAVDRIRAAAAGRLLNATTVARWDAGRITIGSRSQSRRAWAKELDVPLPTVTARLNRGWTPEQALELVSRPPRSRVAYDRYGAKLSKTAVRDGDQLLSRRETAARLGCSVRTLHGRLRKRRQRLGETEVQFAELEEMSVRHDPRK